MTYDFDTIIDRKNTNSLKHDFASERNKPDDLISLWVADMDFQTAPCIIEALKKVCDHGIFGYSDAKPDYALTLQTWYQRYFDFHIEPEWLVKTPGIVYAISTAIRALTEEQDAVLIQQPVYYPFFYKVAKNNRRIVNNPLVYENNQYTVDFADFEQKIIENNVKLFILCSPHNPVGKVFTKEELLRMGEICLKHHVIVVSDEIHADFVYGDVTHHMFAGLSPELLDITVTCTAPSKTFNLASLQASNIFIANTGIRRKFEDEMRRSGYDETNIMGLVASKAAYDHGRPWLDALKSYLVENIAYVRTFLQTRLPMIKMIEPQGTYLIWLDFSALHLSEQQLEQLIIHDAGLWLDGGTMFGEEGLGFQRINIASPRAIIAAAMTQLEVAVNDCIRTGQQNARP